MRIDAIVMQRDLERIREDDQIVFRPKAGDFGTLSGRIVRIASSPLDFVTTGTLTTAAGGAIPATAMYRGQQKVYRLLSPGYEVTCALTTAPPGLRVGITGKVKVHGERMRRITIWKLAVRGWLARRLESVL